MTFDLRRLIDHIDALQGIISDLCEDNHEAHEWIRADERKRLAEASVMGSIRRRIRTVFRRKAD